MEDFYKKHNFDRSIQKNRRFHIVRYYPKIQTYEFLNVGIILYYEERIYYRLLSQEEISHLHCPSLIESKVLKNSLESLDDFLQEEQSLNSTLDKISNRYKNILDTSFQLLYSGDENAEELTKKLFYDYIGYKLDVEYRRDRLAELVESTIAIASEEYTQDLEVKRSEIKGFNLSFLNKRTKKIHHSLLGSIENNENISRAFINTPSEISSKNSYNFLNIKAHLDGSGIDNRVKLEKLGMKYYNYSEKEDINNYFETILK